MVSFPPCKINLGLSVLSKREDGYHNLETCFFPIPWHDVLEAIPADTFMFTSSGNTIAGNPDENLCVKAYRLLKNEFDLDPVHIHLHKIIPSGAGLGGGSSDAAYTLRLLNDIFSLNLSHQVLMDYASRLGSDCAFFVQDKPMVGTGRGEILKEISLSLNDKFFVVVTPNIHVSTADAFANIQAALTARSIEEIVLTDPISKWSEFLKNDFEETVFKKHPAIQLLKEELYSLGAAYAAMSGTGSAVYGIFDNEVNVSHQFRGSTTWTGFPAIVKG
ncbi:MAG TPA: 4-(cytidine 5'-diphospho)-2-C-methyl-D-erythritol kinase [Chryseolinea sp.]|jgi:4-diphosphocytidyl-2-C-methyl-D-erythritol kinase|nr:4-(cytidine 5'-diphospho)-2-C-methyl-D-erythritol kinase [Chryseolinea sp.]